MPVAKELTELLDIDPTRVDRVKSPANGFPVLIMKSAVKDVNAQGGIDEKPDIDKAEHVLQLLAQLIQAEAKEMAIGKWDEICDINLLAEAAHCMMCFRQMEQYGDEDDGDSIMKSAEFPSKDELTQVATWVMKRKVSAAERKRLASEGKALDDGSYPIETAEDLHNAAILARSGHGDVAAAKKLIARRAKELGVANPLADHTAKDAPVPEPTIPVTDPTPTTVTPVVPDPAPVEKSIEEIVAEAVAKEVTPLQEANKGLAAELAALKAQPIPGGPVITAAKVTATTKSGEVAYLDRMAKSTEDGELRRYYERRLSEATTASA